MRIAHATYHAPEGDNKVVEMGGKTFFDGQAVELNTDEHAQLIRKLESNIHFEFEIGPDDGATKPKRGRPSNAEKAAKEAEKQQGAPAIGDDPNVPVIPGPKPGDPAPGTAQV